jgi:uncharacterized alpha-E superfamily protein
VHEFVAYWNDGILMSLLSRVADRIYWGARYVERAEDTARIIRSYSDLIVDLPTDVPVQWEPLVVLTGNSVGHSLVEQTLGETEVMQFLLANHNNLGSIVSVLGQARENLRTTREVLPREAWHTLNGLQQYVASESERAVARRTRDRYLGRVIDESRRLDGVLESTMTRAAPYYMWRLGRLLERADMTTRVVGVRAASILRLQALNLPDDYDEVQWMAALRSVSALQMYQRATRGPIEGPSVVRFLLYYAPFPRSVLGCLEEMRAVAVLLPPRDEVISTIDWAINALFASEPDTSEGALLDASMEAFQQALAEIGETIHEHYLSVSAPESVRSVGGVSR